MEVSIGVRKGAWTSEEDDLLRKCVEKYGEGKWHQVPIRSGLNRCRKSCRLRWLNYLKPNIKRGEFAADEVDLIVRLHELLGNRWSLIAGRIPGRTANDVKNYWNTHLRKKTTNSCKKDILMVNKPVKITKANIFKPRPRTFSNKFFWSIDQTNPVITVTGTDHICDQNNNNKLPQIEEDNENAWWESLLVNEKEVNSACDVSSEDDNNNNNNNYRTALDEINVEDCSSMFIEEGESWWINNDDIDHNNHDDFSFDVGLWDLVLEEEKDKIMM